jgi:hypothetical protein
VKEAPSDAHGHEAAKRPSSGLFAVEISRERDLGLA